MNKIDRMKPKRKMGILMMALGLRVNSQSMWSDKEGQARL